MLALLLASTLRTVVLPPIPREFRAAWVATVDNIDWPSARGIATDRAKAELDEIVERAAALHLNALVFQVRPSADSLYESKLEPWSEFLTGKQGLAPDPVWDPLSYLIKASHANGIEIHAWFNPYRARHPAAKGPDAPTHVSQTHSQLVKSYGKYLWMDPGEPDVQRRTLDVITDVVRRYDLDGIQVDDYFYPYQEKTVDGQLIDFPDSPSWNRYLARGGKLSKGDWRRLNVDTFIRSMYERVKRTKRWVKVGISPFGIYRPGMPEGIQAGVDQYRDLYADARKWLVEGWCDYCSPQLYWPISQKAQAFEPLLSWWRGQNPKNRHIWPGLYTSQTMATQKNWPASEIRDQIALCRVGQEDPGEIHFSMKALNGPKADIFAKAYAEPAAVPASAWLGDRSPSPPKLDRKELLPGSGKLGSGTWVLEWSCDPSSEIRFYAVATTESGPRGEVWGPWSISDRNQASFSGNTRSRVGRVAVVGISRTGRASEPLIVEAPSE